MEPTSPYQEIADFIAAGTTPASVAAFRPTPSAIARLEDLLAKNKTAEISSEEQVELHDYLQLEHFLILAKASARQHLQVAH